jgi:hypothetical protein
VAAEKKRAREEKSQQDELKKKYKKAWMEIKDFKYPTKPEEMEQFFLNNITEAENLHAQGTPSPPKTKKDQKSKTKKQKPKKTKHKKTS